MIDPRLIPAWYVLHTRSRFENVVNEGLCKKDKEAFLPRIQVQSRRKDRKKMIHVPLFPGYVFVRTDLNPYSQLEVLKTIGVVRFVGNASGPLSVQNASIESLKLMVSTDREISTGLRLQKGDRVVVVKGPFVGVQGIFVRYRNLNRVVVNIEALGQFAGVEVDEDDVERLPSILV
ncbi:MAG: UpxY family transcription antiterminator [Desulfobacterales bacterium]|nr:UpxY family transcription antiterminator [Desulfobacterales bacterium]